MEFEKEIRLLANEIRDKVINFVNDNKGNDDIFYERAFLKLNNGKQIIYSFDNETVSITKKNVEGYSSFFSYELEIEEDDISYWYYNNLYNLSDRNRFTDKGKNNIRNYLRELNELVDNMSYNREKTERSDIFKDDVFNVFSNYMHIKEINKMKEEKKEVLPAVEVAVNWWANEITADMRGGSLGEDDDSKISMTVLDMLYPKTPITEEQITKFKESLTKKLMDTIYEYDGEVVQMRCDYGPCRLLYEAMKESGISPLRAPFKTELYIRAYCVGVIEDYGGKDIMLFDSTTKEDIEKVKEIYCHDYNIELDDVKRLTKERKL